VLHWMCQHPDEAVPPMKLQTLLEEAPPGPDVLEAVAELVEAKGRTREIGTGVVSDPIRRFVTEQVYSSRWDGSGRRRRPEHEARAHAAEVFRALLDPFPV
jgi:uncharacterized protein